MSGASSLIDTSLLSFTPARDPSALRAEGRHACPTVPPSSPTLASLVDWPECRPGWTPDRIAGLRTTLKKEVLTSKFGLAVTGIVSSVPLRRFANRGGVPGIDSRGFQLMARVSRKDVRSGRRHRASRATGSLAAQSRTGGAFGGPRWAPRGLSGLAGLVAGADAVSSAAGFAYEAPRRSGRLRSCRRPAWSLRCT